LLFRIPKKMNWYCVLFFCTLVVLSYGQCPGILEDCGGTCVNKNIDRAHCGSCNNACNSGYICLLGTCTLSCQVGFDICNSKCIDVHGTDANNCGTCGNVCAEGYKCVAGTCTLTCQSGLTACSGVCVDRNDDRDHCGACNTACTAGKICSGGVCVTSCQSGLTNCSNTCTNLQTDNLNCGQCGTACQNPKKCISGVCTCPKMIYAGCYVDGSSPRDLPTNPRSGTMSKEICYQECVSRGYSVMGLQNGNECWCGGSSERIYGAASNPLDCATTCQGTSDQYCGGPWRNLVYDIYQAGTNCN